MGLRLPSRLQQFVTCTVFGRAAMCVKEEYKHMHPHNLTMRQLLLSSQCTGLTFGLPYSWPSGQPVQLLV